MRGLVATHGGIGFELVNVVEMIMGPDMGLDVLTNHGKSAQDLTADIKSWLQAPVEQQKGSGGDAGEPAIIFIDDSGGSCANSARLACGPSRQVVVISGVNLAMLLCFVTWREDLEQSELVQRLIDQGRGSIGRLGGSL